MRDSRRTRLVLALLLLASFVLITLDFRGGSSSPLSTLRGFGATIFGPIERAATVVVEPVNNALTGLVNAQDTQQRIEELRRENAQLRAQLRSGQLAQEQAAELQQLYDLAGRGRYRIVAAKVLAVRGALGFEYTATINVGRQDGIDRDMTVICAQGLVGRVVHVGRTTSTVLLAIDGSSRVGARLAESDEIGIVRGEGLGKMQVKLLDGKAPVDEGDRLVTFGSQGGKPYVPGVPIGTIVSAEKDPASLTLTAEVRPYVDFSSLDLVGVVVQPPRKDPRDALLPPRPDNKQSSDKRAGDKQASDHSGD